MALIDSRLSRIGLVTTDCQTTEIPCLLKPFTCQTEHISPSFTLKGLAREAYRLFQQNPSHPGLRFKKVHSDPPIYSARVGIGPRAVGVLAGDTVTWFWIGSHADYDKLLDQL